MKQPSFYARLLETVAMNTKPALTHYRNVVDLARKLYSFQCLRPVQFSSKSRHNESQKVRVILVHTSTTESNEAWRQGMISLFTLLYGANESIFTAAYGQGVLTLKG